MSTSINTNISALAAQSSLRKTGLDQSTAMERLSTGIRINNAKDDAAGLAISTRMTANIRGIAAAVRNANDGISLTQTAEGSLATIGDNLQRIRELAVQSANSGNNASDRAALNAEANQLVAEIDRVANNTAFNGIKLLDGSYQNQSLQVGAGNEANDRISITIGSAKASALGIGSNLSYSKTLNAGLAVPTTALSAGDLSINGFQVGATSADGVSFTNASGSGLAKAAAINAISGQTGVTATVSSTDVTGIAATSTGVVASGDLYINGVNIGGIEASTSAVDRGTQVTAAINAKSSQTGVTATSDSTGAVSLKAIDGRNINIAATANGVARTGLGTSSTSAATLTSANTTETASLVFSAMTAGQTVTVAGLTYTSTGNTSANEAAAAFASLKSGDTGNAAGLLKGTYSGTFTGYRTQAQAAPGTTVLATSTTPSTNVGDLTPAAVGATAPVATITNTTTATGVTFGNGLATGQSVTFGGLTYTASAAVSSTELASAFSDLAAGATTGSGTAKGTYTGTLTGFSTNVSSGSSVTAVGITAAAAGTALAVSYSGTSTDYTSKLTLSTNQSGGITLGGAAGLTSTGQTAGYTASVAGPGGVSALNIGTAAGAQAALTTLDSAINTITDSRAAMGAYQNRLTASIANLETTSMNLQASRSRILDTDYAKETTNLAKSQIITQAATAMLAQANQSAQSVLALLK